MSLREQTGSPWQNLIQRLMSEYADMYFVCLFFQNGDAKTIFRVPRDEDPADVCTASLEIISPLIIRARDYDGISHNIDNYPSLLYHLQNIRKNGTLCACAGVFAEDLCISRPRDLAELSSGWFWGDVSGADRAFRIYLSHLTGVNVSSIILPWDDIK